MKIVNLIIGQKRNLMKNLKSISNCQINKFTNINFFIFWEDDFLSNEEKKFLKKKYKHTYFKSVKVKKFKNEINNILKKNKNFPKNMKNTILVNFLQYSLIQYAFNYAYKKLKYKNSKRYFWQRIRSDIYAKEKSLDTLIKKTLYLPGTVHGYGIIDFHALGTFEEFKVYSDTIDTLKNLYNANIFLPPEIVLRIHLDKFKIKCLLTEKMHTALFSKSDKSKIRTFYHLKGNKFLPNTFSNNIILESFVFNKNLLFRKLYYFFYNHIIKINLKLNNK